MTRFASLHPALRAAGTLLFSLLSTVAVVTVAFSGIWPLRLDVGRNDRQFVSAMLDPEYQGDQAYRWSRPQAALHLPAPPANSPALLDLTLRDGRPPAERPTLIVSTDRTPPVAAFFPDGELRRVRLVVPATTGAANRLTVSLSIPPFQEPNGRELGILVDTATLTPLSSGPLLPPPAVLAALTVIVAAALLSAHLLGARPLISLLSGLAVGPLLAVALHLQPLDVLPFIGRAALLSLLGPLLITAAQRFVPTTADNRLSGSHLATLYALGHWALFWVQLLPIWDDFVYPPVDAQLLIGLTVSLLLLLLLLLRPLLVRDEAARTRWYSIVLIVLSAAAVLSTVNSIIFALGRSAPDFWILFKAARQFDQTGQLYTISDILTNHFGKVFKVPPFYGMLFLPYVPQLGGETVLIFHRLLNLSLVAAVVIAWFRIWQIKPLSLAGAAVLVVLNLRPIFDTIAYGQIDIVLLALLVATYWALRRDRNLLAGLLIAVAALFKVYPVILLAFIVIKRRWSALTGFLIGIVLLNAWSVAVMGWPVHQTFLTEVLPNIGGTTNWIENQTISGFVTRLADFPLKSDPFPDATLARLGLLISLVVVALSLITMLPQRRADSSDFALQFGLFLLLMVYVVPTAWMHYSTLLFLPFATLLLHLRDRRLSRLQAAALLLSFGLISYGNHFTLIGASTSGPFSGFAVNSKFFGMTILWLVLAQNLLYGVTWHELRTGGMAVLHDLRRLVPRAHAASPRRPPAA